MSDEELKARVDAVLRMLLNSGDVTPMGVRMVKKAVEGGDA